MSKFIHADLIAQYAQDAAECEAPWLRWQVESGRIWLDFTGPFAFHPSGMYRRKPKTIRIGEFDVPEPVREPLKDEQKYWLAEIARGTPVAYQWCNDEADKKWLAAGLIHLNEAAAQIHIDAMVSFTRRGE